MGEMNRKNSQVRVAAVVDFAFIALARSDKHGEEANEVMWKKPCARARDSEVRRWAFQRRYDERAHRATSKYRR